MQAKRFKSHPTPSSEVVELLQRILESAKRGYVQSVVVVAVNPLHQAETAHAGDLSPIRANSMLGGLVQATTKISRQL